MFGQALGVVLPPESRNVVAKTTQESGLGLLFLGRDLFPSREGNSTLAAVLCVHSATFGFETIGKTKKHIKGMQSRKILMGEVVVATTWLHTCPLEMSKVSK